MKEKRRNQMIDPSYNSNIKPEEENYDTFLENEIDHYYVYLKQEEIFEDRRNPYTKEQRILKKRQSRTLSFWCFNPGLGFRKILKLNPR